MIHKADKTESTPDTDIVAWKVNLLDAGLASVRYRCIYPAYALEQVGQPSRIFERDQTVSAFSGIRALVLVKTFEDRDVRLAEEARRNGVQLVFDLCDNIFVSEYGGHRHALITGNFLEIASLSSAITTTSEALSDVIRSRIGPGVPIVVIPDPVETRELLTISFNGSAGNPNQGRVARSSPTGAKTLVWFGNSGSPHGDYGLRSLRSITPAIAAVGRNVDINLVVVSNDRRMFEELIAPALPADYVEWNPLGCLDVIARSDVCLLPNSRDAFSLVKSANRAILSLSLGTPVVATLVPALEPLRTCVFADDFEAGIRTYLADPDRRRRDLDRARKILEQRYSLNVIRDAWLGLLDASSHRGAGRACE